MALVFIFEADLWCVACGREKRRELRAAGKAPADPRDEYSYDSDDYPKGPLEEGESDSPSHCAGCGEFLDSDLTRDGVNYVRETIAFDRANGRTGSIACTVWAAAYADVLGSDDDDDDRISDTDERRDAFKAGD